MTDLEKLKAARDAACDAYDAALDDALVAYYAARDAARDAYAAAARDAYDARDAARDAYDAAYAAALAAQEKETPR